MHKAIKDKIQKQDAVTPIKIEGEIAAMSMRQDDNPKVLFDQISTIKFKYERDDDPSTVMPDEKFMPGGNKKIILVYH